MGVTGLDLLFLEVDSLEDSVEFYRDALGFDLVSSDAAAEPPVATLRAGAVRVSLAEQPPAMGRRGRGVHLFFGVADIDDFFECLRARGFDVAPPADEGWGGRFVTLEDPDRYRLFFVAWHDAEGAGGRRLTGSLDTLNLN
jgi:catechol 2,3-dioxygenase-like lactoylglutathione lyase family enzyme